MSNIVFDIPKMKPTILTLVPGLAETVLALAKIKGADFLQGIETIICGGAYVQPKLIKLADSFGITSFAGYGMFSKLVLTLTMLMGRLEILPVLVLFNRRTWIR